MELWGWLVGYVVLFALLHLVLYYVYVRRNDGGGSPVPSFADGNGSRARYSHPEGYPSPGDEPDPEADVDVEFDGETVRCQHCGARNEADPTFTYCWNCISTVRKSARGE